MNGGPAHFRTQLGAPGSPPAGGGTLARRCWTGATGRPGSCSSPAAGRQAGQLDQWLLIVRLPPSAQAPAQVLWLLIPAPCTGRSRLRPC